MSDKISTLLVDLGRDPKRDEGSVNPPVHRTSTVLFNNLGELEAYEAGKLQHYGYGRYGTRTTRALEEAMATLEGADAAFITSSGMAAISVVMLAFLGTGDHALISDSVYGPLRRLCDQELKRLGISVTYYDPTIGSGIAALMQPNTKLVYVESPGSLTFEVQDMPAIAAAAHEKGAIVVGDNTWATPLFIKPFALGMDVSIHSLTKYVGGHSDLIMGCISAHGEHVKTIKRAHYNLGACSNGDSAALALRGLRTLEVRLKQHEKNALAIASWLQQRPEIARVWHPGLTSDPGHALWQRDFSGASGLFAVELAPCSPGKVTAFVDSLQHFGIGYSWGGYESLVIAYHPSRIRTATSWPEDTVMLRFHIGLEAVEDLQADMEQAFTAMGRVR